MFDVGIGILAKMTELGDTAIHDSIFIHKNNKRVINEWGFGERYDYEASNASGEWIIIATLKEEEESQDVIDIRGTLPTRAGSPAYPVRDINGVNRFVVHHTAGVSSATVRDVAAYQTGEDSHLAFPAIAYHFVIESSGKVYWCHSLNVRTWGSDAGKTPININSVSIHGCYTGNDNPTPSQIQGIRNALLFSEKQLGRTLVVEGHRDNDFTACPGDSWPSWKNQI